MPDQPVTPDTRRVLATELDGTLIPLDGNPRNQSDLCELAQQLADHDVTLAVMTGRPMESVARAIARFQLPQPECVICDDGTSIYQRDPSGACFTPLADYQLHQERIISACPIAALRELVASIEGPQLQPSEKQSRFKLCYAANAGQVDGVVDRIRGELDSAGAPYAIVQRIDPDNGGGLIDLVPANVSPAYALQWWAEANLSSPSAMVVAGGADNDLAPLTAGYRTIMVANADRDVARRVSNEYREADWKNRLYVSRDSATRGLLEGCRWFGLFPSADAPVNRLGATPLTCNQTHFRVWAPARRNVSVEFVDGDTRRHPLTRDQQGYFTGTIPDASPGALYRYALDDQLARPDPASKYQPEGVHGPSQIIHPQAFPWTDQAWKGVAKRDLIIYELHVGAFTQEGTLCAAVQRLPELVELGVTAVELMPVAQSPGRWNWGYDGVDLFAVRNTYGEPDDFKAFVDTCHAQGIAVILDVVYNHLGPEGNYLADFGPYFSQQHRTPWGEALNFDGQHAEHVRQFIVENALYWLDEYHLDGLRLDAVHFMLDTSKPTILDEIRAAVSDDAATADRVVHLIAEANVYDRDLLTAENGRAAYDATWSDCLMHSIYTHALPDLQLSHRQYQGAADLVDVLRRGYVYEFIDGRAVRVSSKNINQQHDGEKGQAHIASLVTALQTHDGIGNHPHGKRLHQLTSKSLQKAAAAITLLFPSIPLIFMGEESAADAPFPFFADFEDPQLREAVDAGRSSEYPQHAWQGALLPSAAEAFYRAKCDDTSHADPDVLAWYRDLIGLRKKGIAAGWLCAAGLSTACDPDRNVFSLRYAGVGGRDMTVQVRLAVTDRQAVAAEALSAAGELVLSSEPVVKANGGRLLLQPTQAVVIRSPPSESSS